jgi:signal transduction histidine kinase
MRERSRMMSGQCEIRSKPDEGTDVEIVLPLIVEEVTA